MRKHVHALMANMRDVSRGYIGRSTWFRDETRDGLKGYFNLATSLVPKEYKRRVALAAERYAQPALQIDPAEGYRVAALGGNADVARAVAHCQSVAGKIDWEARVAKSIKATLLNAPINVLDPVHRPVLDLVMSDAILGPVAHYLGYIPNLSGAYIWYSPNRQMQGGSQQYHIDGQDVRQVKCFIPLKSITENTGPFTLLPAHQSDAIYRALASTGKLQKKINQKFDDATLSETGLQAKGLPMTGEPGTVIFVDTCRCYHYGSRPGTDPRLLLHLQFTSGFCRNMPVYGRRPAEDQLPAELRNGDKAELARLVVGLSHLHYYTRFDPLGDYA